MFIQSLQKSANKKVPRVEVVSECLNQSELELGG